MLQRNFSDAFFETTREACATSLFVINRSHYPRHKNNVKDKISLYFTILLPEYYTTLISAPLDNTPANEIKQFDTTPSIAYATAVLRDESKGARNPIFTLDNA